MTLYRSLWTDSSFLSISFTIVPIWMSSRW